MKVILISSVYRDDISHSGVFNKLLDQQKAINNLGHECDIVYLSKEGFHLNKALKDRASLNRKLQKSKFLLFTFSALCLKTILEFKYDIIVFRYGLATPSFIKLLKEISKKQKTASIYIEIPTYPYAYEYLSFPGKLRLLLDRFYGNRIKSYVKNIITYSDDDFILGIPTIKFENGIDCASYPLSNREPQKDQINLLAIGKLWNWYGLDKLIVGLHNYYLKYQTIQIKLIIIGEGPESEALKSLVKRLKLDKTVTFVGGKRKEETKLFFDSADIGIGTLAINRKKVAKSSSLKHREFCCRGLPFIYCGTDNGFKNFYYAYSIEENERPIDIESIVQFYRDLKVSQNIKIEMATYAKEHLGWEKQLKLLFKNH